MCIETYIHDYTDWSVYLFIFYLFSETGEKKKKKLQVPDALLMKPREKIWYLRFTNTEEPVPGIM